LVPTFREDEIAMIADSRRFCTSFEGMHRISTGPLHEVVLRTKEVLDRGEKAPVLVFDDISSELIEVDFRGTAADVLGRLSNLDSGAPGSTSSSSNTGTPDNDEEAPRGPGRPKLGVVAREVTLLPRHWDWLNSQSGGASVALRKLVEEARRANENKDRIRHAQGAAYRFLSAMAGNLPDFEEATRALFAPDIPRFNALIETWPKDVRDHARMLAAKL
jgi:hypothetical protein